MSDNMLLAISLFMTSTLSPLSIRIIHKIHSCEKSNIWLSPCIMCVQYVGGIPWVHRGDIMSTSGGYHEYIGGCSVHRGISWCMWGISWVYRGMCSTSGGLMMHHKNKPRKLLRVVCSQSHLYSTKLFLLIWNSNKVFWKSSFIRSFTKSL